MATVKQLTGLSDETIDEVLKWWARQPRKVQLRAMSVEDIASLVKSAAQVKELEKEGQAKRYDRDLESLEEVEAVRLDKIKSEQKRHSPKARKVWNYRATIKRLLQKDASWADISKYLEKYHQVKITPSYLRRVWHGFKKSELV